MTKTYRAATIERCAVNRWTVAIGTIACFVAVGGGLGHGQQPAAGRISGIPSHTLTLQQQQKQLDSVPHQKAISAGGKFEEIEDADPTDLMEALPQLAVRSGEILLVHTLVTYGAVSGSGDSVLSQYDVQVLHSWKGSHHVGDIVRVSVPAGRLLFPDGTQAGRRVRGFSGLKDGGRYLLFLHSSSENGQSSPSLWIVGSGVQGAFLLKDEKVIPVYEQGNISKAYRGYSVPAFLTQVNEFTAPQR